jgi:hypothetical protein
MIAMLSAAVLALSAAIQVVANFRTVEIVNEEGTQLLKFVRESHASGVVISDLFLINHVAPVYGDTLVMRATEAREAAAVSQRLAARGLTPIVTIDRIAPGTYRATLPHYHPVGVIDTPHARATKWTRQTALASTPQLLATDGVIP